MAEIALSKAVRSNLLNLQSTAAQLGKTQQKLASGLKVGSALDNPTNFFTASSLNSRAGDLGRLLDAVSNATQTVQAADDGLSSITKLVESAQATARQALQTTGAQTTNKVVGSTSATFNPSALTNVSGDNSVTGTNGGAIAADAVASIDTQNLAEDIANIATISTGDLDTGATDGLGILSDASPNGPGLTAGESIKLQVDGVDYTLTFDATTGAGAARTGSAGAGYNLTIGVDQTLASLDNAFTTLLSGSGVTATGTDNVSLAFDTTVDTVRFSDGAADGSSLTKLNLNAVGTSIAATTGDTGDRIVSRNSAFQSFFAANGDGSTLQVALGGGAATTITLGAANVSTKDALTAALNNVAGITATNAGGGGAITLKTTDSNDADSAITLTSDDSATAAFFAFNVAADDGGFNLDTTTGLTTTATAQNLLTQSKVSQGETLDIKIGKAASLNVTFGNGSGEVSTIAELNTKLQGLSGGAASVDNRGEINITSDKAGDTITVGGSAAPLAAFGLTAGEASSLIDGTNIAAGDKLNIQVGTNSALTVTFGTGTGQVNTLSELETALGNLAGGTATIDANSGAITIESTNGTDSITVTSENSSAASKDSVAAAFGQLNSSTPITAKTVDSATRATLEEQYNGLLTQINQLSKDASFNGVNLLAGDDLNVIFNEDGSSKLDIKGVTFDSTGLGLSKVASGQFQTDVNIDNTLTALGSAIESLRSQSATFGSNLSVVETRQDFTKNIINTLETGAANLTLADSNEEAANLLALQTRQQLGSTALSLASQADQSVLRLF